MSVIGFDLSLVGTGVTVPTGQTFSIRPTRKRDARLIELEDGLIFYLNMAMGQGLNLAVMEEMLPHGRGEAADLALKFAHCLARKELARRGIPFAYIGARTLKKYAVGHGDADKQRMVDAAIDLGALPRNDDEADSWWLHKAGRHWLYGEAPSPMHALAAGVIIGPRAAVEWPDRKTIRISDRATR
jgi:Holliday junction resolvasome RuvABC endonuclease subunit